MNSVAAHWKPVDGSVGTRSCWLLMGGGKTDRCLVPAAECLTHRVDTPSPPHGLVPDSRDRQSLEKPHVDEWRRSWETPKPKSACRSSRAELLMSSRDRDAPFGIPGLPSHPRGDPKTKINKTRPTAVPSPWSVLSQRPENGRPVSSPPHASARSTDRTPLNPAPYTGSHSFGTTHGVWRLDSSASCAGRTTQPPSSRRDRTTETGELVTLHKAFRCAPR